MSNKLAISRRNFIKSGAILSVGSVLASDPNLNFLSKTLGISKKSIVAQSFACELFRVNDLLQLKFYFFNAKYSGLFVQKLDTNQFPLFVYCQIPPQHIAEEIVTTKFNNRAEAKKTTSFLAGHSWLAFKVVEKYAKDGFYLDPNKLIDWNEYFELVTLDDFADKSDNTFIGYKDALPSIKTQFSDLRIADSKNPNANQHYVKDGANWPLTTLEVPYKLFLSPIAEPIGTNDTRIFGEHQFIGDNKDVNMVPFSFVEENRKLQIYRQWSNQLVFKTFDNIITHPRFKAVHYLCQDTVENNIELLPAPIHREEILELTMDPLPDRDIKSDMFFISANGATTNLLYKNDNPKAYSTVAWEQKIAEGRDNYVSITFRAIDVFTGLKLKVSIVAERTYDFGISYLPKRYYISYAEDKKNYQARETVSKVPFITIIPKTKGAYFDPGEITSGSDIGYVVLKEGTFDPKKPINCKEAITFDYVGIDKDGKEHNFQSKIIFIPAETFEVVSGIYNYRKDGEIVKPYNATTKSIPVPIVHIGLLNPAYRVRSTEEGPLVAAKCAAIPEDQYTYRIYKTFSNDTRVELLLNAIKAHVLTNVGCYEQSVIGEVTYARIIGLKNSENRVIRADSTASSFETDKLLLFSMPATLIAGDPFLQDFPIIPKLEYANVVISQINQIEGRNVYRKVELADAYWMGGVELDAQNKANEVKLLFKLCDKPQNFFSANYKSAGAVVNPGIDISHISILDQGIIYNESHNVNLLIISEKKKAIPSSSIVKEAEVKTFLSSSIFQNVDAKILGIPILAILEEMLPVEDLPAFSYIKDAQETVKQLESIAGQYLYEFQKYKAEYELCIKNIAEYKEKLKNAEQLMGRLSKDIVRSLLESYVDESGVLEFYESQKSSLNDLKKQYDAYANTFLEQIKIGVIDVLKPVDINKAVETILDDKVTNKNLTILYTEINKIVHSKIPAKEEKLLYFKEAVKIYAIQKIRAAAPNSTYNIRQAIAKANKLAVDVEESLMAYHTAMLDGLQEASSFAENYLNSILNDAEKKLNVKKAFIAGEIAALLQSKGFNDLLEYIGPVMQLAKVYENYRKFFASLKLEHYELLYTKKLGLPTPMPTVTFDDIEQKLVKLMIDEVSNIKLPDLIRDPLKTKFEKLQATASRELKVLEGQNYKKWLSNYEEVGKELQALASDTLTEYSNILLVLDNEYAKKIKDILDWKKELFKLEEQVKNFVQGIIEKYEKILEDEKKKIINAVKGSSAYVEAAQAILSIQKLIKKLKEFSKQSIDYNYSTKKFKNASLGVIEFLPNSNTELEVKVNYQIELEISPNDLKPSIKKQSFVTNSSLTDFKLGLLQFLYIDFERVKFISGSEVNEEFVVKIRDVQFAGMLSFVQAFQQYLQTIDDNLVFDIDSSGVRVGYGFAIPDFPAGYFNFFNLNFTGLLTLPFDPKKSLQLMFGIGSDLNKFGITVMGIFGGQGYFNIIAETGRGIVGMILVLEFGAIYKLEIGAVARGTAYLVGGIYIRKYYDSFLLKGYILCVGRFDIIFLFSASLSFYLGLEYDGHVLKGSCQITVSKRFSRFFEISVRVRMDKTIAGARSDKRDGNAKFLSEKLVDKSVIIEDTNLNEILEAKEHAYLTLTLPAGYQNITTELIQGGGEGNKSNKKISYEEGLNGNLAYVNIDPSKLKKGGVYSLNVKANGQLIYSSDFNVAIPEVEEMLVTEREINTATSMEYYESYF